jgi:hypothetical protein
VHLIDDGVFEPERVRRSGSVGVFGHFDARL